MRSGRHKRGNPIIGSNEKVHKHDCLYIVTEDNYYPSYCLSVETDENKKKWFIEHRNYFCYKNSKIPAKENPFAIFENIYGWENKDIFARECMKIKHYAPEADIKFPYKELPAELIHSVEEIRDFLGEYYEYLRGFLTIKGKILLGYQTNLRKESIPAYLQYYDIVIFFLCHQIFIYSAQDLQIFDDFHQSKSGKFIYSDYLENTMTYIKKKDFFRMKDGDVIWDNCQIQH